VARSTSLDRLEQRKIVALLGGVLRGDERVLDMPAGYGRFIACTEALASRSIVVADISAQRLPAARAAMRRDAPLPCPVRLDLQRGLPFTTLAVDVALCVRYLHHIDDPTQRSRVLGEVLRVSKRFALVSYYKGRQPSHAASALARRDPPRAPARAGYAGGRRIGGGVRSAWMGGRDGRGGAAVVARAPTGAPSSEPGGAPYEDLPKSWRDPGVDAPRD
jgi:SAM-dependent methyltransferase